MADFYGTVEGYKAYHLERGNDVPVATDPEIASALIVASEWIDGVYRIQFGGSKVGMRDQVREWPRVNVIDQYGYAVGNTEPPREIISATYEATARQLATPGSLLVDYVPGKYKSVSISGAVSVQYSNFNSAWDIQTQFALIDLILFPILTGVNGGYSSLSGGAARV